MKSTDSKHFFFFFQYTFIGYTDYKYFRCFISGCDNITDHNFEDYFTNFAIPNTSSIEDKACLQYEMINPEGACTQDNFNMDKLIACNKHIYSPDVQYEFSLIEDYDIPPCPNGNWALEVILNEFINLTLIFSNLVELI